MNGQTRKKDTDETPKSRSSNHSETPEDKVRSSSLADLVAASASRSRGDSPSTTGGTNNGVPPTVVSGGDAGSCHSSSGRSSSRGGGSSGGTSSSYTQRRSPYGHAGKKFPRSNSNSNGGNGSVSELSESSTKSTSVNGSGRSRSTGHRSNSGHRGGSNAVIDSNGPAGKIRGTAHQLHDRYTHLAQDSKSEGDRINTERLRQYAEHYHRIAHGLE